MVNIYSILRFFIWSFSFSAVVAVAQQPEKKLVKITGKIVDEEGLYSLQNVMVVNKRSNTGIFADSKNEFTIYVYCTDTIVFKAKGFLTRKLCLRDSAVKSEYRIVLTMRRPGTAISEQKPIVSGNTAPKTDGTLLPEVEILAPRTIQEIQKDASDFGIKELYATQGLADAMASPFSFFYERYSHKAKAKHRFHELMAGDYKNEILKEMLRYFNEHKVINLPEEYFDDFIVYLDLPNEFYQYATTYELSEAIKQRYLRYVGSK